MSLYSQYLKEREDLDTLECEEGFAIYKLVGKECYLQDVYIQPRHRFKGRGSNLVDAVAELAKNAGCKVMTTSVCPSTTNSHISMLAALTQGFKLFRADKDAVYFVKEIG